MRAIGYPRVSSQEQIDGTSLRSQEEQIRAYASLKGFALVALLVDAGVSGGTPLVERPAGSRVVEMLRNGEADCLIITKLDRGFRSASDCLNNVEVWEKQGISLHILNLGGQSIDTSTPTGKFFITVMAGAAELERNLINERCNEGRKARRAEGKRIGEIPYGFDLECDTNKLVTNDQEQVVIRLMRELRDAGHSFRQIADELNRRAIPTKKAATWTHKQVASVLRAA